MSDTEHDRRISAMESRLNFIDQHGSRGVDGLRLQVATVDRDLSKLQATVEGLRVTVDKLKPPRTWPSVIAYAAAMIPMYALVIDLIVRR